MRNESPTWLCSEGTESAIQALESKQSMISNTNKPLKFAIPLLNMPRKEEDSCIFLLRSNLDAALERIHLLEIENEKLRKEVQNLKADRLQLRVEGMDGGSMLWKMQGSICDDFQSQEKQMVNAKYNDKGLPCSNLLSTAEPYESPNSARERLPRKPKTPPRAASSPLMTKNSTKETSLLLPPPPPPPPLPSKSVPGSNKLVRRVPEVLELYRSLTKKEGKSDTRSGNAVLPVVTNSREMIGEIENKSAYLLAIKSDVETQGEFINFLTREVENAVFKEISDVEAFIKWLDRELSYLVDERAVLKHFPSWPEKKADAIREAAFSYRDLKNLQYEISSFHDDKRQPIDVALKLMQALQEKLEHIVHNLQRARDNAIKRYKDFRIPWEWMLDSGIIVQLKFCSMKIAKDYMSRVVSAVRSDASSSQELMLQGARFAFRVHQFAGGFNDECHKAFNELKILADKCYY